MKALPPSGPVVAIDVGGTKTALLVTGQEGGSAPRTDRVPTLAAQGPRDLFARIEASVAHLLGPGTGLTDVVGVGMVCPGIATDDGVLFAPNTPGWESLRVREVLAAMFPAARITVMNDVKAAALAEVRQGLLNGVEYGLYLNIGTGLSCALVVRGTVLDGANGAAGEIAYQALDPDDLGAHDGRAPLEETFSGAALAEAARAWSEGAATPGTAFDLARAEPDFSELINERMRRFATAVANLATAFDPARIVVGGGMAERPEVFAGLAVALKRLVPFPPVLLRSDMHDDASLTGALIAAREAARPGRTAAAPGDTASSVPLSGRASAPSSEMRTICG
ncbi:MULTISPECIES: ROK family protein [unclassified Streptomyces]|uniref:ROK family protein n=1 Tax=unclassified Streptomyces TaxID=2593676 RepID=UPI00336A4947